MTEPGSLMPMTLGLTLTNVDPAKTKAPDIERALRAGRKKYPLITSGFLEIKPLANSRS